MSFNVEHASFSGPLDLLLTLIEGKKLHVSEISLSNVTDDFARYVTGNTLELGDRSRYVSILATLLLIKARTLVPRLALAEEEEQSIEELTVALAKLAAVRAGAKKLAEVAVGSEAYAGAERPTPTVFAPGPGVTLEVLFAAAQTVLQTRVEETETEVLPEVRVRPTLTIADALERVREAITGAGSFNLSDAVSRARGATDPDDRYHAKVEAVVLFLALLEVVRSGLAEVSDANTDDIPYIKKSDSGVIRESALQ